MNDVRTLVSDEPSLRLSDILLRGTCAGTRACKEPIRVHQLSSRPLGKPMGGDFQAHAVMVRQHASRYALLPSGERCTSSERPWLPSLVSQPLCDLRVHTLTNFEFEANPTLFNFEHCKSSYHTQNRTKLDQVRIPQNSNETLNVGLERGIRGHFPHQESFRGRNHCSKLKK